MKQLLILKQQIVAFDIEFINAPDTDLAFTYANAAEGSIFNPTTLFRRAGALLPRVVENMLDAKTELDARLRECITSLTRGFADDMTAPLKSLTAKNKKGATGQEEAAKDAVASARLAIERHVPGLRRKLSEYLDEVRTVETLVGAVEDVVLQAYEDFYDACMVTGAVSKAGIRKGKGKGREDDVWDPETFGEWTGNIFGVVRFGFDEEDDRDRDMDGDEHGETLTRGRSRVGST